VRQFAYNLLLTINTAEADSRYIPPQEWLLASEIFALAESPYKMTREIALTLIRRHYQYLGGVQRLAWLMESPAREVRLFAVRLLWDQHRPVTVANDWQPQKGTWQAPQQRFESDQALQQFLRVVLYGLPPGRMERRATNVTEQMPERALPASESKRRLLGIVRDLALEQHDFAVLIIPVLVAFQHSQAKGEWQSVITTLMRIRQKHPDIDFDFPQGQILTHPIKTKLFA
jgi:hypothetical protein